MIDKNKIEAYFDRLWPINRSLTGNGNRESLKILSEIIPLRVQEVKSGTTCYDWTIPPEWNVKDAWIKDSSGKKIVDFKKNNLHLLGYSTPFCGKISLTELKQHLYTLPEQPELIPYLTSYYKERWGFCISHKQLESLVGGEYEVLIDSELNPNGSLTFADLIVKGESEQEVMFSTYICHPSLANNELSGPLVTAFIYDRIKDLKLRYTYRFVFIPETIGSIYYLSKYGEHLKNKLLAGYVVTTVGDNGKYTYKRSRQENSLSDQAAELVLEQTEGSFNIEAFAPNDGSDERQYCSPGFNLPIGSVMRTMYGKYKEYHTSADNKDFLDFSAMAQTIEKYVEIIKLIEANNIFVNQNPFCEPQLGKRGLYPTLGSQKTIQEEISAIMWLLNMSDGKHDLISICKKSGVKYQSMILMSAKLLEHKLLALT